MTDELTKAAQAAHEPVKPFGQVTVRRLSQRHANHVDQYQFYPAGQSPYLDNVDECHTVYTHPAAQPMPDNVLAERSRIIELIEGRAIHHNGPHILTLELNQLAKVIKSGLGWLEYERSKYQGAEGGKP